MAFDCALIVHIFDTEFYSGYIVQLRSTDMFQSYFFSEFTYAEEWKGLLKRWMQSLDKHILGPLTRMLKNISKMPLNHIDNVIGDVFYKILFSL